MLTYASFLCKKQNRNLNEQILQRASYAHDTNAENEKEDLLNCCVVDDGARFGISSFTIICGTHPIPSTSEFALTAPSTRRNVARLLRALQLARKPILLEGSPGVGKTSIVSALAKAAGHKLVRLNLSEQTDMMDLLGADLPASGGEAGEFKWSDGAFLAALKNGDWVLLDELNLQHLRSLSASVLSGGEVKRLTMARVMINKPKILLLDEPYAALDPQVIQDIQKYIFKIQSMGVSIIITDHNIRNLFETTDRNYVIADGSIIAEGTSRDLLRNSKAISHYFGSDFSYN